jgi:hypothetical protein
MYDFQADFVEFDLRSLSQSNHGYFISNYVGKVLAKREKIPG